MTKNKIIIMIRKCLNLLVEKDYKEQSLKPKVLYLLDNFNNDQLLHLLKNGLKISEDIILYYINGMGFRCMNENTRIIGNKPICNIIEKNLNEYLLNDR